MFARQLTPEKILTNIRTADLVDRERKKRLFYAHLYISLNYAIENKPKTSLRHLYNSVANTWGPTAGYGPNYMWHAGRLHYNLITTTQERAKKGD